MDKLKIEKRSRNKWIIITVIIAMIYIVSLFVPYVSNATRYPYYFIKCGGRPVTATDFAASRTYTVPNGQIYYALDDVYFCTEQEAQAAGYRLYP